ncbi:MAG TPA: molybdopterin-guanine dinucleotide biosynthesis protein B [Gelria sp.]|jgi:molybdopterin-guanine dinucleotide biosynthesis protein B|nr:molybdopterin-guanine dinucleotide biosynthesis protein B [Gelria sp.]
MAPIISFVGKHNSGKTTLLTGVVNKLEQRGIKTAVIKHAHKGLDLPGNFDSDRLFAAGASIVYASSPEFSLIYRRNQEEWSIEQIYAQIANDVDLIITEGFKGKNFPKIEVLRREISTSTLEITNVLARVADFPLKDLVPTFTFNQQEELIAFILEYLEMK